MTGIDERIHLLSEAFFASRMLDIIDKNYISIDDLEYLERVKQFFNSALQGQHNVKTCTIGDPKPIENYLRCLEIIPKISNIKNEATMIKQIKLFADIVSIWIKNKKLWSSRTKMRAFFREYQRSAIDEHSRITMKLCHI